MKINYNGNYFQLPNTIFAHHLTGNAFMLYAYLISKTADWLPMKSDIQKQLGLGRDAVDAAFNILIQHGFLIQGIMRKDKMGRAYQSYKLNPSAESKPIKNLPELPKRKRKCKKSIAENTHPIQDSWTNSCEENQLIECGISATNCAENPVLLNTEKNKEKDKDGDKGNDQVQIQSEDFIFQNEGCLSEVDEIPFPESIPDFLLDIEQGCLILVEQAPPPPPSKYVGIMHPDFTNLFANRILERNLDSILDDVVIYDRWLIWLQQKDPACVQRMDAYITSYITFREKAKEKRAAEIEVEKYQAKVQANRNYSKNPYNNMLKEEYK